MKAKPCKVVVFCLAVFGLIELTLTPLSAQEADSAAVETGKVTVGTFTIDVPRAWKTFKSSEAASLRRQYMEQSRQIYQHYHGSDDPSKSVDIVGFHLPGTDGSFVIVSFTVPPQSNLIPLLKSQVNDKMNYGIQQGIIRKYLGLVSVDEDPLSGFYTKAVGKSGNINVSGGIEHKELKNTMIQLTLLAPKNWTEAKATSSLSKILKSVTIKKN